MSRAERSSQPPLIAGLITPATNVTDPQFVAPLGELESLIAQRADWLSEKAIHEAAPWYRVLPEPRNHHQARDRLVRDLAAYRERYQANGEEPLGTRPQPAAYNQLRDYERLSRLLDGLYSADESGEQQPRKAPTSQVTSPSLGSGPDIK